MHALADDTEEGAEEHDGSGVVEQAFSLDQPHQPQGHAKIAKNADHCRRVRGRNDGAEQKRYRQRDAPDK